MHAYIYIYIYIYIRSAARCSAAASGGPRPPHRTTLITAKLLYITIINWYMIYNVHDLRPMCINMIHTLKSALKYFEILL